nr:MAG TPA: hypothetical protein [Caudoviricetes sp.]
MGIIIILITTIIGLIIYKRVDPYNFKIYAAWAISVALVSITILLCNS